MVKLSFQREPAISYGCTCTICFSSIPQDIDREKEPESEDRKGSSSIYMGRGGLEGKEGWRVVVHFSLAISFVNLTSTPSSQSLLVIEPIQESSENPLVVL